jgi:hypothetical protein
VKRRSCVFNVISIPIQLISRKVTVNICSQKVGSMAKCKGNVHRRTGYEGPEGEQMYSPTLPSTSALDGGGWSTSCPSRFTSGKDPVLYRRLGGPQGLSGLVRKISPPPGFDRRTVQPVASRCAIPAP